MSEGKRKAKLRAARQVLSRPLTVARFDIYAMGSRLSFSRFACEELSYWADANEQILGLVFRDTTDDDYGWILLARDRAGRFRSVDVEASLRSEIMQRAEFVSELEGRWKIPN